MNSEVSDVVIETRGLTKIYKKLFGRGKVVAVQDINLEIHRGEIFGLLGPNGSGKTTTLKLLLGLVQPTKGTVRVLSKDPRSMDVKGRVGFLPEESYLYRFLNADETLQFVGRLAGLGPVERHKRSEKVLEQVGLTHARKRASRNYSKGMARRLGLAQVLLKDPEIVFLDEPTLGLDPVGSRQIKDLIYDLKKRGKTIVLSSHLLTEIENICDRLVILNKGRLVRTGRTDDLLEIKSQLEIILENVRKDRVNYVKTVLEKECSRVVKMGHPKKSLDDFFLETLGDG